MLVQNMLLRGANLLGGRTDGHLPFGPVGCTSLVQSRLKIQRRRCMNQSQTKDKDHFLFLANLLTRSRIACILRYCEGLRVTMSYKISSVFKSSVFLETSRRLLSSVHNAQYQHMYLTRQCTRNLASYQQCCPVFTSHRDTKRWFSEVYRTNPHKSDKDSLELVRDNSDLSRSKLAFNVKR